MERAKKVAGGALGVWGTAVAVEVEQRDPSKSCHPSSFGNTKVEARREAAKMTGQAQRRSHMGNLFRRDCGRQGWGNFARVRGPAPTRRVGG